METSRALSDPDRLERLRSLGLMHAQPDASFDRLTRLSAQILGVPVALVSFVGPDRQFLRGCIGLPEPWASRREMPLSHSFCQHAVATAEPLLIEDARQHPLLRDNEAVRDLRLIAYAGIPLLAAAGEALGTLCVIDHRPRRWTAEEVGMLRELAASVTTEIDLRAEVAERRRAEQALRESETLFRQLAENVQEVFWVVDARENRMVYVSPAFERIWGRGAEGMFTDRSVFLESIHPEDRARVIATPDQVRVGEYAEDYRIVRPDGQIRWIRDCGFPVYGGDGEVARIVGVAKDVTERKRREQAEHLLAEVGAVLTSSLDPEHTLPAVVGLVAPALADYCAVDLLEEGGGMRRVAVSGGAALQPWARRVERALPPDPAPGRPVGDVLRTGRPELASAVTPEWLDAQASDPEHRERLSALGIRSLLAVPLATRGRRFGVIVLATGPSARLLDAQDLALAEELGRRTALAMDNARLYQEARQAVRAREELLRIVSHELRFPLQASLLEADLLRKTVADQWQDHALAMLVSVRDRTALALRRVGDLTDITQIEAGHLRIRRRAEDPHALAHEAIEVLRPSAAERCVRLESRVADELPAVWADRERLLQVLVNLVCNGIRASPRDGVVQVRVEPGDGGALFSVSDSGPWIPPDRLPLLFDGSWRPHDPLQGSVGLGLAIAKGIVEAHGGRIWAESEPGRGSTLRFTMPAAADDAEAGGTGTTGAGTAVRVVVSPDPPDPPDLPAGGATEPERRGRFLRGLGGSGADEAETGLLRERILGAVYTGDLRPGDRLPGIRELARRLGTGYYGALQLYRELEADGLLEARGRSGTYLRDPDDQWSGALGETARWVVEVLDQALAHRIRLPLLPDLLRRYSAEVRLRCACVESTLDGRTALGEEVSRYFGLEPVPVPAAELDAHEDDDQAVPACVGAADLIVTTVFHARAARRAAARLGRPVAVATVAPAAIAAIEAHVRQEPLAVVCVDPRFGERIRSLRNGRYRDRILVVPAEDEQAVARLRPSEPVLLSRAAHERLAGMPLRLLVPLSPFFAPPFTRDLARIVVHLHATGGGV